MEVNQYRKPKVFFFNDTATTETYTLSLHDALPIWDRVLLLLLGVGVVADSLGPFFGVSRGGCRRGYRPYFENYTVDASILKTHVCVFLK